MNYGPKIKYVRSKVRDMTLTELAKQTGLSTSYLSDSENGKCEMSIKALEKVAEVLRVTSSYLLDKRNMTLENLTDLHKIDIPIRIKEYMMKQKSLPYIKLIKEVDEKNILSIEFLESLINLHEKEANKRNK